MNKASFLLALAGLFLLPSAHALPASAQSGNDGRVVRLEIFDGLNTTPITLDFSSSDQSIWSATKDSLKVTLQKRPLGSLTEWIIHLENRGGSDLRLQPQLIWDIPNAATFDSYWDGSQKQKKVVEITEAQSYDNLRDMAPWLGLLSQKRALVLGSDPGQILSFVQSSFRPASGEKSAQVSLATRLIIAPNSTKEVRLFSADLDAPFGGERELVQRVHDAYPQWFLPDPGAPSSVWGVGAHYWMSGKRLEDIPGRAPMEFLRRMHVSWEWCYAPFKRAGDHWGEAQWWDYKPLVPFEQKKGMRMGSLLDFSTLSREDLLKKREEYFNKFHGGFGFMFYTPFAAWVEIGLAQSEFPDALITDPNHKFDLKYWVTGYDRELLLLPWFTSYENVVKRQFKKIAETYDIHGFAFDVALGGARYRGPATKRADAPRAYDEKGDFIDLGAAGAEVLNYVKTLHTRFEPNGRLVATINGMRTFNSAVRGDYGMLEGTPFFSGREQIPLSRYLFGQKPATWWKGWAYTRFAVPNWQRYDQEHFLKTMKGLVDYTLFSSFEWGNLPTLNYEFGVPKMTDHVPILIDSLKRGWQAVFPVDFAWEGSVHTGRYGKGLSTRLFWGNPYEEARQISATVDNTYLGDTSQVFASRLNGPDILDNELSNGRTRFDLSIPSRNPVLVDAVAGFPINFNGSIAAALKVTDFQVKAALRVTPKRSGKVEIQFPALSGYALPNVTIGGQPYEITTQSGYVSCIVELSAQPVDITTVYSSSLFLFDPAMLEKFPFFTEGFDPGFILNTNSLEELSKLSNDVKVREFFSFYAKVVKSKENPAELKVSSNPVADQPSISIQFDPKTERTGIFIPKDNQITFVVRDCSQLQDFLNQFFSLLDKKFPYHPGFTGTWGMDPNLLRHVDMVGKNLETK